MMLAASCLQHRATFAEMHALVFHAMAAECANALPCTLCDKLVCTMCCASSYASPDPAFEAHPARLSFQQHPSVHNVISALTWFDHCRRRSLVWSSGLAQMLQACGPRSMPSVHAIQC